MSHQDFRFGESYTSPATIQALAAAKERYHTMIESDELAIRCAVNGIEPYNSAGYNPWLFWEFTALHSYINYNAALDAGEDPGLAALTHLTLLTPKMMLDQAVLKSQTGPQQKLADSDPIYEEAVHSMDYYQRLVRATIAAYPDLKPSELEIHLRGVAEDVIASAHLRAPLINGITRRLLGIQCEAWTEQALRAAGCYIKPAGRRGKVRRATDLYYMTVDGRRVSVDVKASDNTIYSMHRLGHPGSSDYAVNRTHVIIVLQPFDTDRLTETDSFHLSHEEAIIEGQRIRDRLEEAATLLREE